MKYKYFFDPLGPVVIDESELNDVAKTCEVESDCAICLEEILNTRVLETPCRHLFHAECIEQYLIN